VIVLPESFSVTHRKAIIAAAARYNLAVVGPDVFPRDGGLMSYWIDTNDMYSQAPSYIDRILKGANPANLPVQEPTKFSLILNLKNCEGLPSRARSGREQMQQYAVQQRYFAVGTRVTSRPPHRSVGAPYSRAGRCPDLPMCEPKFL
jgi:ABC transporter substrate binding protein